ncbi:hypothetical protein M514_09045, partial [Trichuris suis]
LPTGSSDSLHIIASFEYDLSSIEQNRVAEIKSAVANLLLRHQFTQTRNLHHSDIRTLRNLRANNERIITKANKGNVVVVLDRSTNTDKMNRLLKSSIHCPLRSDPTDCTRKALRSLLLDYAEESKEEKISILTNHLKYSSSFKCPELYGLPKIHKPDMPFRPIVSSIQSITRRFSSYLKGIIQPLVGNRGSTIINCKTFIEQIRLFTPSSTDILLSYDVKDLFTSIPFPYTLNVLHELLYSDCTLPERTKLNPFQIIQLVSFCMFEGNFFHFQGRYFRQKASDPMGSPLSPVLAEVFIEHLEDKAFSEADHIILPHLFKRYVDDIFVIIESGREEAFLNFLSGLFPNTISFTFEKEVSGKSRFLDSLVIRASEGLKTSVYRKPIHSDRYIHFSSHHPRGNESSHSRYDQACCWFM